MKYSRLVEKNLFTKHPSIKILLEEEGEEKEMKDPFSDLESKDEEDSASDEPASSEQASDDEPKGDPMADALGSEEDESPEGVSDEEKMAQIQALKRALDAVESANEKIEDIVDSYEDEGDFSESFDDDVESLLGQYIEQNPIGIADSYNRKVSTILFEADEEEVKNAIDDLNDAFEERKKIPPASEWLKLSEKYLDNWDIVDTAHEILKKIQYHFSKFTDPEKDIKFNEFLDKFKILVKSKGGVLDKNYIDSVNYSTQAGAKDRG